ncbi:MAG: hypothetical protein IJB86_05420 [Clostridia bacterium]|nr:hypothetical protein [Clostridia bacterium]
MNFSVTQDSVTPGTGDLALINEYTRKELSEDDVYTFSVILCDNEIDRDFERFSKESLNTLCEMFKGKTGIFDHSMKASDQTARIYKTELVEDPSRVTSVGEVYTFVKGFAYMPKTSRNEDLIREIDSGIKKEVSIGCAVKRTVCSECDTDISVCSHIKGQVYGKNTCHGILTDPYDAYEWSFVAVPAQKGAGVTKAFSRKEENITMDGIIKKLKSEGGDIVLSKDESVKLCKEIASLEKDASLGREYREKLLNETLRLAMTAMPNVCGESLKSVCEKLTFDELCALKSGFSDIAGKRMPVSLQLSDGESAVSCNNEFKI